MVLIPSGISQKSSNIIYSRIHASSTVPGAPTNVIPTALGNYIHITWTYPDDDGGSAVTNYKIYKGTTPGGETYLNTQGNVNYYWDDMSVTAGTMYYYKISAVNSVGEGVECSEVSARCVHAGSSFPTTSISFGAGWLFEGLNDILPTTPITLTPHGGTPPYTTWYSLTQETGGSYTRTWGAYSGSFTMAGNSTGIYLMTWDSMDNQWYNGTLNQTSIALQIAAPALPNWITVTPGYGNNTIAWNYTGLIGENVIIYRGTVPGGLNYKKLCNETGIEVYVDANLLAGQTRYYVLAIWSVAGTSANSSVYSGTPAGSVPTAPYYPQLFKHFNNLSMTWYPIQNSPVLPDGYPSAGDGGAPITNYEIYEGVHSGNETFLVEIGNVTNYIFPLRFLYNYSYYFEVAAKNSFGIGPKSWEVNGVQDNSTQMISYLNTIGSNTLVSDVLNYNNATVNATWLLYNYMNDVMNNASNQVYTTLQAALGNFGEGIWFTYGVFDVKIFVDDVLTSHMGNMSMAITLLYELAKFGYIFNLPLNFSIPSGGGKITGGTTPGSTKNIKTTQATYTMYQGSSGNVITWGVSSNASIGVKSWTLYKNGILVSTGTWTNGENLTTSLDTFNLRSGIAVTNLDTFNLRSGVWNITLDVEDYVYNKTTSEYIETVFVTVLAPLPTLTDVVTQIVILIVVVVGIIVFVVFSVRYLKKRGKNER